jgi:hypothetical protein
MKWDKIQLMSINSNKTSQIIKHLCQTFISNLLIDVIVDGVFKKVVQSLIFHISTKGLGCCHKLADYLVEHIKFMR